MFDLVLIQKILLGAFFILVLSYLAPKLLKSLVIVMIDLVNERIARKKKTANSVKNFFKELYKLILRKTTKQTISILFITILILEIYSSNFEASLFL